MLGRSFVKIAETPPFFFSVFFPPFPITCALSTHCALAHSQWLCDTCGVRAVELSIGFVGGVGGPLRSSPSDIKKGGPMVAFSFALRKDYSAIAMCATLPSFIQREALFSFKAVLSKLARATSLLSANTTTASGRISNLVMPSRASTK